MVADSVVSELRSEGFVGLRAGFDPEVANRMRSLLWRQLAMLGAKEFDPATWPAGRQGKASKKGLYGHRVFESF